MKKKKNEKKIKKIDKKLLKLSKKVKKLQKRKNKLVAKLKGIKKDSSIKVINKKTVHEKASTVESGPSH